MRTDDIDPILAVHSEAFYRKELQRILAQVLGIAPELLLTDRALSEVGFDSNKILHATTLVREVFGPSIGFSFLWDNPTIDDMASTLAGKSYAGHKAAASIGNDRIAVVGLAFRFPGASEADQLWQLLANGENAIKPWPTDRGLRADSFDFPKRGGFLSDIDRFDAAFFGLSMNEAIQVDPQHRMLLETSWRAIENSGRAPKSLSGCNVGTFIGISTCDYSYSQMASRAGVGPYLATGNALSLAANRISYFLNLTGPSLSIDTACSSSLVAMHHACQSLLLGDCDVALAGGVNLILRPEISAGLNAAGMLAPDGLCKVFDEHADGYVRGEGCAVFVLKRLSDARRDEDHVHAVILGSATNHDGRTNGLTAPSGQGQQRVIRKALERAGISARSVAMVETHGTGTAIGDVIEVEALNAVYGAERPMDETLWLSGVKANLGHLEAAAGCAGMVKALLCMANKSVPRQASLATLNTKLPIAHGPLKVAQETVALEAVDEPLRVAVSSFGFGGANAHLIFEECQSDSGSTLESALDGPVVVALSAKSKRGVQQIAQNYLSFVSQNKDLDLREFAASVNCGREHFHIRCPIVCENFDELVTSLSNIVDTIDQCATNVNETSQRKFILSLTTEIAQLHDIAELYETEAVFRSAFMEYENYTPASLDLPLSEYLYLGVDLVPANVRRILTVLAQIAYVSLWQKWLGADFDIMAVGLGCLAKKAAAGELDLHVALDVASRDNVSDWEAAAPIPDDSGSQSDCICIHFPPQHDRLPSTPPADSGLSDVFAEAHAKALASLYADGAQLQWTAIYPYNKALAARLPNYPFERKSFWFPTGHVDQVATSSEADMTALIRTWREFQPSETLPLRAGAWLFIGTAANNAAFGRYSAANRLDYRSINVDEDGIAWVDLIGTVCGDGSEVESIIYQPEIAVPPGASGEQICAICCEEARRALALIAALNSAAGARAVPFYAVLNRPDGQGGDGDAADIVVSFLAGLFRSALIETTSLDGHIVSGHGASIDKLFDICRGSLHAEKEVSLHGEQIRVPRLVHPAITHEGLSVVPSASGAQIVTGGLGGVGMIAAEWLIDAGSTHVILLQASSEPKTAAQKARIEAWIAAGIRIDIVAVDVTSRASLTMFLQALTVKVTAIVYAAGSNEIAGIDALDEKTIHKIVTSKLLGWLLINELIPDLEFAIAITSVSGVWGAPFLAAYSAANHAVDAIVSATTAATGIRASLAFGPIADGGMVNNRQQQEMAKIGLLPISRDQVKAALTHARQCGTGSSVHAHLDMPLFSKVMANSRIKQLFCEIGPPQAVLESPTGKPGRKPHVRFQDTRMIVMQCLMEVLELDDASEIDWNQGFFELGLDSLLVIELREKMESIFEIDFPVNIVFDYPSLDEIVLYIDANKK